MKTSGKNQERLKQFIVRKGHLNVMLISTFILLLSMVQPGSLAYGQSLPPNGAAGYTFTTFHVPGGGFPYSINNQGLLAGDSADDAGLNQGFVGQYGDLTTLNAPGWAQTYTGQVNERGLVACGGSDDISSVSHAFVYHVQAQTWTPLPDIPGKPYSFASAINNKGLVAGMASDDTEGVGWLWDGAIYSFFSVPDAVETYPWSLNDRSQMAGFYADSQFNFHGFLRIDSALSTFDAPGADSTFLTTINNLGDVAGYYFNFSPSVQAHGFILHAGQFIFVDVPGAVITLILGLNDQGQLTGGYVDASGVAHGFIATPIGGR